MNDTILALDIGTSSSRALLYDAETAHAIAGSMVSRHHDVTATPDGGSTLDAETLVQEVVACAGEAARKTQGTIRGVAISTFWHSFVGVGKDGRARTPVLLWSDRRSAPQVARLRDALDDDAYTQRTGCPLHTSFVPGRLLWLKENDPKAFAESVRFLSPGEYLFARLFGGKSVTCSISMASGSGLLNQPMGDWDAETLGVIGIGAERLSPLGEEPLQGLTTEFREALPTLANVPWFPASGDGACSNVGCGAVTPDVIALMIGTSGAMRVMLPPPPKSDSQAALPRPPAVPKGLWRYEAAPGRFLLGGALSNGGAVWAWLQKTVQLPHWSRGNVVSGSSDQIEAEIAGLPPDGHGLTVLPFLSGERAPLWRDDLRATVHGLSASTTPVEIARAFLEAVAYRFARLRSALKPVAPSARIIGTGAGLLASPTWAQIIADVLGEPILLSSEEQASSRGAVLLARDRLGIGRIEDAPFPVITQTLTPHPDHTETYRKAAERQEELLKALLE